MIRNLATENHSGWWRWLTARLARELILSLGLIVFLAAGCFLALSYWLGDRATRTEHEAAARWVAQLFEASLHNAMLNRDLAGMKAILGDLGNMPGVERALVLTPSGEIRFGQADSEDRRGQHLLEGLCVVRGCDQSPSKLTWGVGGDGNAMRIAYPIRNGTRCAGCHGDPKSSPVNGVLVVDFEPPAGLGEWRAYLTPMVLAGGFVMLALAALVLSVLTRTVLSPVRRLGRTAEALASGDLGARAAVGGRNEFARLGGQLDAMAQKTGELLSRVEGQRAYLQRLIDSTPVPLLVIGPNHRVVEANRAYRELVGVDEPLGRPCYRLSRGLDEPCPSTLVRCPVAELSVPGARAMRCVMQFRPARGASIDVEIDAAPLVTVDGQRLIVESIHPLEQTLKFSQEQRLSAIGLLANGMAHEIHNPLASIRIALQASLRGVRDGSMNRDEHVEYLRLVDREIDRCVSITQRLMRMSQPPGATLAAVDVAQAIGETLSLLSEEASRSGVRVHLALTPEGLKVRADDSEFRMVVLNLVQNALHAMPGGGEISITGKTVDQHCVLEFRDTGVGISPEDLALIFLPFYSRRADGRRGTGLGLAICRGSVERWNGRIEVRSALGAGSVFTLTIPLWESA